VIFAIGINDTIWNAETGTNAVTLNDFKLHMQILIDKAKTRTEKVYILGLTKVNEERVNPIPRNKNLSHTNTTIENYNEQLEKICKTKNVPFISLYGLLSEEDLSDGLHPTANGHKKICDKVLTHLFK
jgi:lysophospholipase L1-like esterase